MLLSVTRDMGFCDKGLLNQRLQKLKMSPQDMVLEVTAELYFESDGLKQAVDILKHAIDDLDAKCSNKHRALHLQPSIIKIDIS